MSCEKYNNRLEIYQQNSKTIFVAVYDSSNALMDLSGWSGAFYAKKYPDTPGSTVDVSVGHATVDSSGVVTFNLGTTDTSLAKGDYIYEVIVEKSGYRISVVQDKLTIVDSIKY